MTRWLARAALILSVAFLGGMGSWAGRSRAAEGTPACGPSVHTTQTQPPLPDPTATATPEATQQPCPSPVSASPAPTATVVGPDRRALARTSSNPAVAAVPPATTALAAPAGAAPQQAPPGLANLPTTGPDISGMFTLGVALVVTGVLLIVVRRQRDRPVPQPEPSDWY